MEVYQVYLLIGTVWMTYKLIRYYLLNSKEAQLAHYIGVSITHLLFWPFMIPASIGLWIRERKAGGPLATKLPQPKN